MQSLQWVELIGRVPRDLHDGLVILTTSGLNINLAAILRIEENLVVVRGRIGGSTDTGYTFFVPYDQIMCLYYSRPIKESEIAGLFAGPPVTQATAAATESADALAEGPTAEALAAPLAPPGGPAAAGVPGPAATSITTRSGAIPLPGKAAILERLRKRTGGSAPGIIPKPPTTPDK